MVLVTVADITRGGLQQSSDRYHRMGGNYAGPLWGSTARNVQQLFGHENETTGQKLVKISVCASHPMSQAKGPRTLS